LILTTPRSAPAAGLAHLSRPLGTSRLEGLLLLGREDLIELGLGLFFQVGNLFLLLVGKLQLLGREAGNQMESAARTARATGTAWTTLALASRTAGGRPFLPIGSHHKGGHRQHTNHHQQRGKTSHGNTP
jgi:hypothetical protein